MLNYLVRMTAEFESNVTSIERIQEYFKIPQEVNYINIITIELILFLIFHCLKADWEKPEAKPPSNWPDKGRIEFQHYYLRYRDDLDHALKDINCSINAKEKVNLRLKDNLFN